jgi:DNA polymerase I
MDKINELKEGRTPLDELVIYTQLKKSMDKYKLTSPELAAAKKAKEAGIPIEEGSLVGYIITQKGLDNYGENLAKDSKNIITRKGTSISDKAMPADQAKDYDADYYINHQVIPAVLKILKELGVKKEDLLLGGKQADLGDWH